VKFYAKMALKYLNVLIFKKLDQLNTKLKEKKKTDADIAITDANIESKKVFANVFCQRLLVILTHGCFVSARECVVAKNAKCLPNILN
jgi:hypothetical protein